MTGRELIIYILQNNLEDEVILSDDTCSFVMTEGEAATKFGVGVPTIKTWYQLGIIKGCKIGETVFYFRNQSNPRYTMKWS